MVRYAELCQYCVCHAIPGQTGARFNPYEDAQYSKQLPADGHLTNQWPFVNRFNCDFHTPRVLFFLSNFASG